MPEMVPGELKCSSAADDVEPGATWRFVIHSQHPEHQETSDDHHHHDHQETQKSCVIICGSQRCELRSRKAAGTPPKGLLTLGVRQCWF